MTTLRTRESLGLTRRYTFRLYPSKAQSVAMEAKRRDHQQLYNALLQQRIEAYDRTKPAALAKGEKPKSLTFFDQGYELTALRAECPEWADLPRAEMEVTAKRVQDAYTGFFSRYAYWKAQIAMGKPPKDKKTGRIQTAFEAAGFPTFRPKDVYPGWGYKAPGNGWSLSFTHGGRTREGRPGINGARLMMRGIGTVKARGELPSTPLRVVTCSVTWRADKWWLSLVVEQTPRMQAGDGSIEVRLDLIDRFAAVAVDGGHDAAPERAELAIKSGTSPEVSRGGPDFEGQPWEPRVQCRAADSGLATGLQIDRLKSQRDRCKRGSRRWKALKARIRKAESKQARQRREQLHAWSTAIVRNATDLTVIAPESLSDIVRSGKGDEREWGAAVRTKAMVNRHVLGQAPGAAISMLEYKAREAGIPFNRLIDETPPAAIGNDIVEAKKATRRARKAARRQAKGPSDDTATGTRVRANGPDDQRPVRRGGEPGLRGSGGEGGLHDRQGPRGRSEGPDRAAACRADRGRGVASDPIPADTTPAPRGENHPPFEGLVEGSPLGSPQNGGDRGWPAGGRRRPGPSGSHQNGGGRGNERKASPSGSPQGGRCK